MTHLGVDDLKSHLSIIQNGIHITNEKLQKCTDNQRESLEKDITINMETKQEDKDINIPSKGLLRITLNDAGISKVFDFTSQITFCWCYVCFEYDFCFWLGII